jgi:hypothetical protein
MAATEHADFHQPQVQIIEGASGIDARFEPNINHHKTFKNNNSLTKLSGIVYF